MTSQHATQPRRNTPTIERPASNLGQMQEACHDRVSRGTSSTYMGRKAPTLPLNMGIADAVRRCIEQEERLVHPKARTGGAHWRCYAPIPVAQAMFRNTFNVRETGHRGV